MCLAKCRVRGNIEHSKLHMFRLGMEIDILFLAAVFNLVLRIPSLVAQHLDLI